MFRRLLALNSANVQRVPRGPGIYVIYVQAVNWYRKAADAGDTRGISNLTRMCTYGWGGLPKDDVLAVSWSRKAADACEAARHEYSGFHVRRRPGRLAETPCGGGSWYRKAVARGDTYAKGALKRLVH
jgi:hypothetical protein